MLIFLLSLFYFWPLMLNPAALFSLPDKAMQPLTLNSWGLPCEPYQCKKLACPLQPSLTVFWRPSHVSQPTSLTPKGGALIKVTSPSSWASPAPLDQKNLRPIEVMDVWRRAWLVELMLKPRKWSKLLKF